MVQSTLEMRLGGSCFINTQIRYKMKTLKLDHTSSMTFDPMSVHIVSVRTQMCYTTAGKIGHAMSNGRISEEYGDVRSTLSMNMWGLLLMRIM